MLSGWQNELSLSIYLLKELKKSLQESRHLDESLLFQTILKNRTAHGGILADGAGVIKHGENGKGIHSRWYPQTIAKRITNISLVAERIRFDHGDAFATLSKFKNNERAVFFIDPPYTAGGKRAGSRLYTHNEVDHARLF